MKPRSRTLVSDLDAVISEGNASIEETKKKRRGRPGNKVPKKQCLFYLPENLILAIDAHCRGNKSAFVEEIFTNYFNSKKIEY